MRVIMNRLRKSLLLFLLFYAINCTPQFEQYFDIEESLEVTVYTFNKSWAKPLTVKKKEDGHLEIFCYVCDKKSRKIRNIWTTTTLQLRQVGSSYAVFKGPNVSDVFQQYKEHSGRLISLMSWRTSVSMDPFNNTCAGISTLDEYVIDFKLNAIDIYLLLFFTLGILLFISADQLSKNELFFYCSGTTFGILASLLILLYILSRYMPKRSAAYGTFLFGSSMVLWLLQYLWENLYEVLKTYQWVVVGYFVIVGLVTLAVCYYKGPVVNPRALNILKWSLQLISILLIYNSCQIREVFIAIVLILVAGYKLPIFVLRKLYNLWRRFRPFSRRLLTEEEYVEEGEEETRKALLELREYCRSPQCDAWKTMSRVSSPQRFAKFIEGDSHISDDELRLHTERPTPRLPRDLNEDDDW